MELSSEQHLQEMATDCSLEDMIICTTTKAVQQERKPRPQQEQALKCPRCDSTNTKFCYYNNYSLTQPRYFCKSCRRYWTNGGTLRNIPVGGGCRKNKRPSSCSKRSSSMTSTINSDHHQLQSQPHYHHMLLLNSSSLSDQYHSTRQKYNPLSANFSSQMSSYDNDNNDQYHDHQPAACSSVDLSQLVFARLQKQQASSGGGGYIDDHHGHIEHNNNNINNLSLLGNYSNSHVRNLMGLSNDISDGSGGHHGFLAEGLKANNDLVEQTDQFQNNRTNFQNLYNGGFGSNDGSTSCSMSNISGDQMMTIPCEDHYLAAGISSSSSSFGTPKTAGGLLLKQLEDYSNNNNIHHHHNNNNVPRSSQILWGGAAARFPWHQINADVSSINGHDIVDHSSNNNIINNYNMFDNAHDLAVRENMNVFAAAAPVWQGLINSP